MKGLGLTLGRRQVEALVGVQGPASEEDPSSEQVGAGGGLREVGVGGESGEVGVGSLQGGRDEGSRRELMVARGESLNRI